MLQSVDGGTNWSEASVVSSQPENGYRKTVIATTAGTNYKFKVEIKDNDHLIGYSNTVDCNPEDAS
ncbi:hypothetical protein GCM10023228_26390 [Brevibacillus fulvus]